MKRVVTAKRIFKLRPCERVAWSRWRPNDSVAQVLAFRANSGMYPMIKGGLTA